MAFGTKELGSSISYSKIRKSAGKIYKFYKVSQPDRKIDLNTSILDFFSYLILFYSELI